MTIKVAELEVVLPHAFVTSAVYVSTSAALTPTIVRVPACASPVINTRPPRLTPLVRITAPFRQTRLMGALPVLTLVNLAVAPSQAV